MKKFLATLAALTIMFSLTAAPSFAQGAAKSGKVGVKADSTKAKKGVKKGTAKADSIKAKAEGKMEKTEGKIKKGN